MAFNGFISVIQLQFDLIQTSDVCDLPPTKGAVGLSKQRQMANLEGWGWRRKWGVKQEEMGGGEEEREWGGRREGGKRGVGRR